MALEYSGPRAVNSDARDRNRAALAQLHAGVSGSAASDARADSSDWRARGGMMLAAEAFDTAYHDFDRALTLDPSDVDAARGYVRAASQQRQVLCITHLPQIAAFADAHFRVEKHTKDGRTITRVLRLSEEARVEEIARMLGGSRVTGTAREHASQLVAEAQRAARKPGGRGKPRATARA